MISPHLPENKTRIYS